MINGNCLKKESFSRRLTDIFSDIFQLSGREIVYVLFLAALLTFFSTIECLNEESDQPSQTTIVHYGFPFESLKKVVTLQIGERSFHGYIQTVLIIDETVEIIWLALVMNLVVYALLSFVIVKVIVKVREEIYFRKCMNKRKMKK